MTLSELLLCILEQKRCNARSACRCKELAAKHAVPDVYVVWVVRQSTLVDAFSDLLTVSGRVKVMVYKTDGKEVDESQPLMSLNRTNAHQSTPVELAKRVNTSTSLNLLPGRPDMKQILDDIVSRWVDGLYLNSVWY